MPRKKSEQIEEEIIEEAKPTLLNRIVDSLLIILLIGGLITTGFYGFKIFVSLVATPVLSVYNAATNLYILTEDPSVFISASRFTRGYLNAWSYMIMGLFALLLVKTIKKKRNKNE